MEPPQRVLKPGGEVSRGLHRSPDAPTEANALIQGAPAGEELNSEMRPTPLRNAQCI